MLTTAQQNNDKVVLRFSDEHPFALCDDKTIELARFVADLSRLKQHLELSRGDVLISCKGRYAFSLALLATWQVGRLAILPPNVHQRTLEHIALCHDVTTVLDDGFLKGLADSDCSFEEPCLELSFYAQDAALIIYTSGSSGEPKAIKKTIGNLFAEALAIKVTLPALNTPLVASVPPNHLYGLTFSIVLPWVLGVAIVDVCPLHAEEVLDTMHAVNADLLITVPVHLSAMLKQEIANAPTFVISSAGRLDAGLAKQWYERFGREIFEVYGSTETGVIAHRQQLSDEHWQAFPEVFIDQCADCLQVASPFIHSSEGEVFQSKDKVSLHKDGFILHGRADGIIKIAGKRVSLLAVEQAMKSCEGIVDAAVVAVPVNGHIRDMTIWAALACDEGVKMTVRDVRAMLHLKLDSIEMPRRISIHKALPREDNGKLRRSKILALFEANHDS
ncbi:MAG: hypothetical protein COB41_08980 [Proteobacteria bacterium]|nr:MAG: hypothetical protein COB41_08980 [Pseudomonadota bacterium]